VIAAIIIIIDIVAFESVGAGLSSAVVVPIFAIILVSWSVSNHPHHDIVIFE
jgi:hypothetical protein